MGFAWILAGLCFTFEPNFRMFDFFPDFLGMLLIIKGLTKLSKVDENLCDARKNATVLFWISVAKLLLCMWTTAGHYDYLLPYTFAFCVLEGMFLLSFFRNMYVGIEYTAQRCGGEKQLPKVSVAFSMAAIFTVVSRVLAFAPRIIQAVAQNDELDLTYKASRSLPLSFIEPYVELACLILSFTLGIVYICVTIGLFARILRDREYRNGLYKKYNENYLSDREIVVTDVLKGVYPMIAAGIAFFLDLSIDAVGVIPNPIGFCLLFWACARLGRIYDIKRVLYTVFSVGFGISVVNYIYMTKINLGINYLYSTESFYAKEFAEINTGKALIVESVFSLAEAVLFVTSVFVLCSVLTRLFEAEKRRNGLINLFVARIFAIVSGILFAARNITRTYAATLAARHEDVREYIINKASINTEEKFLEAMENPYIRAFENTQSIQFALVFAAAIAVIVCAYCFISVSVKTEGAEK